MKLKAKILAVAACAIALTVALTGCGGGGNSADNAANFQGNWVLTSGNVDGQEVTPEVMDEAAKLGMSIYMQFNEDGSCVLDNMMVAAHSLGVSSCWIHGEHLMFELPEGKALLKKWGLSESLRGVGSLALGYADGQPPEPKPRKEGYIKIV